MRAVRRVLICGAETGAAYALASSLRRHWGTAVDLVTADSNPREMVTASLLADLHLRTPSLKDPAFLGALESILRTRSITDYIPLNDAELDFAEQLRPLLPTVAIWSCELMLKLTSDKVFAHDWLRRLGIPVPLRYEPGTLPGHGEVFVKPRRGFGSRGATTQPVGAVRSMTSAALQAVILQEVCLAPEISVDSFYDATTGAQRAVMRQRLAVRAGVCTAARVFDDPALSDYARRIGDALGQRGTICFQVMRSGGAWVVTDLNLRPGAGVAMSVAVGIDLLGAALACRWGQPYENMISRPLPPEGLHVTRQYAEFVMS